MAMLMARKRKAVQPTNDPRILELARTAQRLMELRGLVPAQLAALSKVDSSHLGKWLVGTAGLAADKVLDVFQALGAQLVVHLADEAEGDPRAVPVIGTMNGHGNVTLFGRRPTVPSTIIVESDLAPFKKGDKGLIEPGAWSQGRWALVQAASDGRCRLLKCELHKGDKAFLGTEIVIYEEAKHRIFGIASARVERLSE